MKPFEFNNAIDNLIALIEMKSFKKAQSQLNLISDRYKELYSENELLQEQVKQQKKN